MNEPILSAETTAFLEGLCFASNMTWTEAGMGFKLLVDFMSESNKIPAELRETPIFISSDSKPAYASCHLRSLARFVIGSIGGNTERTPNSSETEMANVLVLRLHSDLNFDWYCVVIDECEFGMDLHLRMGIENSNQLATLNMSWQID